LDTVSIDIDEIIKLCPHCDIKRKCEEFATVEQLSLYCLEGIFKNNLAIEELQQSFQKGPLDK